MAIRHIRVAGDQPSTRVELTPHLIAAEPLIEELREQAREWRDHEMHAFKEKRDRAAEVYRAKAIVLEEWANRIERRAIGGGR